jgi:hypothetical protein
MEALQIRAHQQPTPAYFMNPLSSKLKPTFSSSKLKALFCTSSLTPLSSEQPPILLPRKAKTTLSRNGVRDRVVKETAAQLKENWLESLTCPFPHESDTLNGNGTNATSDWVLGIDPDLNGALALLKSVESSSSAQVSKWVSLNFQFFLEECFSSKKLRNILICISGWLYILSQVFYMGI